MKQLPNPYLLIVILVVLLLAILPFTHKAVTTNQTPKAKATVSSLKKTNIRTYLGSLPCNSPCTQDEVKLILTNKTATDGTYRIIEQRVGQGNASVEYSGDWTMAEGLDEDPHAQIIVLDPDDEEIIQGYYIVDSKHIEELDTDGYRYDNPASYRLTLQ